MGSWDEMLRKLALEKVSSYECFSGIVMFTK